MAEEREKIRFEFLTHTLDTRGRFGCAEERIWPYTIGMNEKGGMTEVEFEKYIDTSIVPLGHARQTFPVEGEQQPGMQWVGALFRLRGRKLMKQNSLR
jgi:hypothetical protein